MIALLSRLLKKDIIKKNPSGNKDDIATVNWVKGKNDKYHRLMVVNENSPTLIQQSAVFVVWEKWGNKITWLYVGSTEDMAKTIYRLKNDPEIAKYEGKGRVGITWAILNPKFRSRVAAYLKKILNPIVENPDLTEHSNFDSEPFAVHPPIV